MKTLNIISQSAVVPTQLLMLGRIESIFFSCSFIMLVFVVEIVFIAGFTLFEHAHLQKRNLLSYRYLISSSPAHVSISIHVYTKPSHF